MKRYTPDEHGVPYEDRDGEFFRAADVVPLIEALQAIARNWIPDGSEPWRAARNVLAKAGLNK